MAKKRKAKPALATAPEAVAKQRPVVFNVLLDWRFNLAVLVSMELLLIAIFWGRERTRAYQKAAVNALWSAESRAGYEKAYKKYWWLYRRDPSDPGYMQGLGDAALGLERYSEAERLYKEASGGRYDRPGIKLSLALLYRGRALKSTKPDVQIQNLRISQQLMDLAFRENPRDLRVNYWKAMFALSARDYVEAAEFFSRVRKDLIPRGRAPNILEKRLIADAKEQIKSIKAGVLKGGDYSLDVSQVTFRPPPPRVEDKDTGTDVPTSPPAPVEPKPATTPTL